MCTIGRPGKNICTLSSHIAISKVGKNPGFMSIAQPSGFYWENPGFTRLILGFTG